ncbi:MAG: MATE family efflux transporter [Timaviella obliquedivisa GSE-PSE-MK23-08B]|nr:MATE family efflux transporter [Timaviella obliquedivisa GSE-PSE-MK23-08B]
MSIRSQIISEVRASLFLALPLAGAQMAQAAIAFVDTAMMGQLGSQTLAAGGLGAISFGALLIIGSGIVAAVSPIAAEAHGAGQPQKVGQVIRQGFLLAILVALPIMALIWHMRSLLSSLGQPQELLEQTELYLRAIVWGYLPGLGFAVLKDFASAISKPRSVIIITLCSVPLNIVGNDVLMYGKLGLPALGLEGIGWSSTIVLWSMFLAIALYIRSQRQFRIYGIFQGFPKFDRGMIQELLHIGLPIGIIAFVETGLFTVTTFLIGQIGVAPLAAHQIALETAGVTFRIPLGIAFATTVRVGQLVGQNNLRGARFAGYVGIALGAAFMGSTAILFWTMPRPIVALFLDVQDPANAIVVELAQVLLGVAAMFQIFDGIQVIAVGALRGLKDTRIPMVIGIFAYWGIGLVSGYGFGMVLGWGAVGLWWGLAMGLAVAAGVLTWRFSTIQLRILEQIR